MPTSDYAPATSGALKFKGGAGIDKKRKKKKPKPPSPSPANLPTERASPSPSATDSKKRTTDVDMQAILASEDASDATALAQLNDDAGVGKREKTEAERRHDERRRKRLDERLKREGVKTHKERVEELNRYLSGLSEHHDMYVSCNRCWGVRWVANAMSGRELDLGNKAGVRGGLEALGLQEGGFRAAFGLVFGHMGVCYIYIILGISRKMVRRIERLFTETGAILVWMISWLRKDTSMI